MTDAFEQELRTSLRDAAHGWAPSESHAMTGERLLQRLHRRRAQKAATAVGLVAAGLAAVLIVGQVMAEPQSARQVASPTTLIPGGTTPTLAGPGGACLSGCAVTTGPPTSTATTSTTASTEVTIGAQVIRTEVGPTETLPPPPSTAPPTVPPTTQEPVTTPVTSPATTLPPPPSTTEPPPTTVTTMPPPPPQVFTITAGDMGKTVDIRPGDDVLVDLVPCPGGSWGTTGVTDATVLLRTVPPASIPPPGTTIAEYQGAVAGLAKITARQRSTCLATPTAAFAVTIVVT